MDGRTDGGWRRCCFASKLIPDGNECANSTTRWIHTVSPSTEVFITLAVSQLRILINTYDAVKSFAPINLNFHTRNGSFSVEDLFHCCASMRAALDFEL